MIKLTRLNESELVVNAEMVIFVEAIPDTILTLTSGKKIMVSEPVDLVVQRIIDYKRGCNRLLISGE